LALTEGYVGKEGQPEWSRDGKALVYVSHRSPRKAALRILSADTNTVITDVYPKLANFARPRWAPDGSITVQGSDAKGRYAIYSVDVKTGDATALVPGESGDKPLQASWSNDGKTLAFRRVKEGATTVVIRDVAGTERELARAKGVGGVGISPSGASVAYLTSDARGSMLNVVDVATGQSRTIHRVDRPASLSNFTEWTPDGQRVLIASSLPSGGAPTLWSIPATGGEAVKLQLRIDRIGGYNSFRIHPDGRRVTFADGEVAQEVWKLEHFLPPAKVK
jgi:Tol biopolymer transport system component